MPSGKGGKREGAGRPLLGDTRTVRRSVTLEEAHWRWLDAKGNASAALRELVTQAMAPAPAGAVQIGPGYRLSVNILDDGRIRLAVYDPGMNYVAGYEGMGTSDREGCNALLTEVRPPD